MKSFRFFFAFNKNTAMGIQPLSFLTVETGTTPTGDSGMTLSLLVVG